MKKLICIAYRGASGHEPENTPLMKRGLWMAATADVLEA
jgi:glycerophosphoryl diester phosphodiesterase